MHTDARLKQADQILVHILKVIRNVETDQPFACKLAGELLLQPSDMLFLHGKYQIGPANMPRRHLNSGLGFGACRPYLVAADSLKNGFRR